MAKNENTALTEAGFTIYVGDDQKRKIQTLKPRHREIARRLVLGQTLAEISKSLHITPSWLSMMTKSPLFVSYLEKLNYERDKNSVDIGGELQEIAPEALDNMVRTMHQSDDPKLSYAASKDLLAMAGYGPITKSVQQVNKNINYSNYSQEEMKALLIKRLNKEKEEREEAERRAEEMEAIEVEFVDVPNEPRVTDDEGGNDYGFTQSDS